MWYKIKRICIKKWKKNCIIVSFFIWIVIKNYWCDIKSKKGENILILINIKKYKKLNKKKYINSTYITYEKC
jgi:hypothetical protein